MLIAVRDNIKCHEKFKETIERNEAVAVEIESRMGPLLIASVYIPPDVRLNQEMFEKLYSENNNCIILGDLNAALKTMDSRRTNSKGKQLQKILEEG